MSPITPLFPKPLSRENELSDTLQPPKDDCRDDDDSDISDTDDTDDAGVEGASDGVRALSLDVSGDCRNSAASAVRL